MCEILICTRPRGIHGIPRSDHAQPKAGDLIAVQEDGWTWGECELGGPTFTCEGCEKHPDGGGKHPMSDHVHGNHPFFRIIKLPNVSVAVARQYMLRESDSDENPAVVLQYRQHHFDYTKLDHGKAHHKEIAEHLADDSRKKQFIVSPITEAEFVALFVKRPRVRL